MKLVLALLLALTISAWETPASSCPQSDTATTVPAPVDLANVGASVFALKTTQGARAIPDSDAMRADLSDIFSKERVSTKMEQFYGLLFSIARHLDPDLPSEVSLDSASVRSVLLAAKVFTDPAIPDEIKAVTVARKEKTAPRYTISFGREKTDVPLNRGEGFYLYRNGLCQHAQSLVFSKDFSVRVAKNKKGNTVAKDFSGVDLFGVFGNRGIINVDIRYVSLRAVEFYRGTPNGKVTAYVSREEFEKHDHNPLLRVITRYVPDKSVQPIDW